MKIAFLKKRVILFSILTMTMLSWQTQAGPGENNFKTACSSCHTIGGGKLVGPDLAGVSERRSEEWLIKFIKSSQSLIKSGDAEAIAVFKKFFKIPMPDQPFSNSEIKDIISYIGGASTQTADAAAATTSDEAIVAAEPSAIDVALGADLFQGTVRLKNGGAACNSCHDVKNDAVIGGGILAKDLTSTFSNMGAAGITSIIGTPPFPVMEAAYKDKEITKDEVRVLAAFLQHAHSKKANQQSRDYGLVLIVAGIIGTIVLLGLYSFLWSGRKKEPVNQAIFARQKIVSTDE